jgi:hypothetical protein
MPIYNWIDRRVRAFQIPNPLTPAQAEIAMASERGGRDFDFGYDGENLTVGDQLARPGEWIVMTQDRQVRVYPDAEFNKLFS